LYFKIYWHNFFWETKIYWHNYAGYSASHVNIRHPFVSSSFAVFFPLFCPVTKNLSKKAPAVVKGNGRSQQKAVTRAAAGALGRCCAQIPQEYYTSALGYGEEHLPMATMLGNKSKMLDQKKKEQDASS